MEATNALVFVVGVYVLTLVVALFVVLVIIGIRRITADRPKAAGAVAEHGVKKGEVTA